MTREGVLGTTLKTVERALDVLEMVAQSDEALQIKDIADKLDHNLSSTYHTVNTLLTRQY
jgi:DNA-binding IclR family transcriptional regulator